MAPGQVPHHNTPWKDAHSFYLLSPLMGFLSRAWSLLRGPGPLEPWLVEAVIEENRVEDGLEKEAKSPLTSSHAPWGRHSQEQAELSRASKEDGEAVQGPCLNLNANSYPPEPRGLSGDNDKTYREEEANSIFTEQGRVFTDGQPVPLSPSLPKRTLQASDKSPGEERTEEEGVAISQGVTKFSYPSSHWEGCPVGEEEEVGDTAKEAPGASPSPISLGSKPSTWAYCPGEEEDRATEEKGTENIKARKKTSISPSSSDSNFTTRGDCSGRVPKEKGEKADPEPCSSVPAQRGLVKAWERQPSKDTEEEDEDSALEAAEEGGAEGLYIPLTSTSRRTWVCRPGEDTEEEDSDSGSAEEEGEAEAPPIPPTSAFLKTWVYQPGEDSEEEDDEEDEDSDLQSAEEEGETEATSPTPCADVFVRSWVYGPGEDTEEDDDEDDEDSDSGSTEEEGDAKTSSPSSAFLKAWVYQPGEDTEEDDDEEEDKDSDSGSAEEEGDCKTSSPTPASSAFLKAWVCKPGEDTEEEDACEEDDDEGDDSEAAEGGGETESGPCPDLQAQSAPHKGWIHPPGEEPKEEEAAEEWGEAEPRPFRVTIYVPGEKPPSPWAAPKLPLRLQRRLRLSGTPIQDLNPETPLKARKVRFSEKVAVHFLVVWAGPAQAARRGPWEQLARDRSRFARRIARAEEELGPCLTPAYRARAWERLGNPPPSLDPTPALPRPSLPP